VKNARARTHAHHPAVRGRSGGAARPFPLPFPLSDRIHSRQSETMSTSFPVSISRRSETISISISRYSQTMSISISRRSETISTSISVHRLDLSFRVWHSLPPYLPVSSSLPLLLAPSLSPSFSLSKPTHVTALSRGHSYTNYIRRAMKQEVVLSAQLSDFLSAQRETLSARNPPFSAPWKRIQ
jgi:hypothetical protein